MRKTRKLLRAVNVAKPALPAIACAALSSAVSAALNVYEPFDYSAGQLQADTLPNNPAVYGTAAGGHWGRAGVGNPPPGINVTVGSLTGPAVLPPSVGNELSITHVATGNGASNRMPLGNGTAVSYTANAFVYYSFALNVTDLTNSNNTVGDFFFSFNNTSTNNEQTNNPSVQPGKVQIRIDPTDPTKYNLGVFGQETVTNAASSAWASNQLSLNTTQFIVGAVNPSTKEAKLWINPDPGTFGLSTAPTFTSHDTDTTTWSGNNLGSVLVRQFSDLPNLIMDELRVGGNWSDVTPTLSSYWDVNGATAGAGGATPSGTWDGVTANWSASSGGDVATAAFPGVGYKAVFAAGSDATGAYTVTVSGTQSASALSFEEGSVTLTGGTVNVNTGVIASTSVGTTIIRSDIAGSSGLNKSGSGTVVLSGSLNYTGNTTISGGTLQIGEGATAGSLPVGSVITDNGTLAFNRSTDVTQGTDFNGAGISGTGGITQAGTANLILNVPNTYSGTTKATAGTLTVANSLAIQNSTLSTGDGGTIVFDPLLSAASIGGLADGTTPGVLPTMNNVTALTIGTSGTATSTSSAALADTSAALSVTKVGSNTQVLSGPNTYTGGTTINGGTLRFTALNTMPATGTVAVNSGGALSVRAGGAGEWTNGTDASTAGTLGALIGGKGGQGNPVVWADGSTLEISTLNAPVGGGDIATNGALSYSGNIGAFSKGAGNGTTNVVGFRKTGSSTSLMLSGANTFSGPLSVADNGGYLRLASQLSNAGQSFAAFGQTVPTVTIGTVSGSSVTDGSADVGIKVLTDDALPTNSLISFGSSVNGTDTPSSLLQLFDGFAATAALPSGPSFNQTIRGITGGGGRVKTGLGTLTINVPTGESYKYSGTLRTDFQDSTTHGRVIKTGPGEQDWNQSNSNFNGDFILQQGTVGVALASMFGTSGNTTAKLIIQGGKLVNITSPNTSLTPGVPNVEIGGDFTFDVNGPSDSQFTNDHVTLTTANPTITVINSIPSGTGQFILKADVGDNGQGFGFTKAGPGILNLNPRADGAPNTYSGATTIQEGSVRVVALARIGNGNSDVDLSGGTLEWNGSQGLTSNVIFNVTNPVHVNANANSSIAYNSTSTTLNSLTLNDANFPGGIEFEFDNNTFTYDNPGSGTLTFEHRGAAQGITYRPRFTGTGFTYNGPVVISNGGGTRKTVLESGNTSGTQSWSGNITGDGSYSRLSGGNTVFGGQLVSIGGVTVANNSNLQMAHSAGNDHVLHTTNLSIGTTSSQLDLTNNKLITPLAVGNATGNTYGGVTGLIQSGRNGGGWAGNGIVTSETNATTGNFTSLGVASAQQVKGLATATDTAVWAGQTVTGSDTLVMYTYGGDANLDGKINVDDYGRIDFNVNLGTAGWFNGDFNYDGKINVDDYGIIDFNVGIQGAPFPTGAGAAGLSAVSAVPEPASLSLVLAAACGLARRRRRAKKKDLA